MVVSRLLPRPATNVDPLALYSLGDRPSPDGRPYVVVNMVSSVDGATALDGVTEALGSATDRDIFLHLRELADAIMVGASTVRAEHYGPARLTPAAQADRGARNQSAVPPIVVPTSSIDFDWDSALFTESRPILIIPRNTNATKLDRAARSADIITCGDSLVDLSDALPQLHQRGINLLLCEGGPTLNTELFAADLIDELCLTISPFLVGGQQPRGIIAAGPTTMVETLSLVHVLEEAGFLFLRYRKDPAQPARSAEGQKRALSS